MSTQLYNKRQEESVDDSESQICRSTDYAKFTFDPRNRPIDPEHVSELMESIQRANFLHLFPMIVSRERVIQDGQHRFEAAKALGLPFYYVVSEKLTIADVPLITETVQNWSAVDYLHNYCGAGLPDYLVIRDLWKRYPFLRVYQILGLSHIGDAARIGVAFRRGTYKANGVQFCVRVCEAVLDFRRYENVTFYNHSYFVNAISNLMGNRKYSHERMMKKMEFLSRRLVKCPDTDSYIALLNDIYNYKATQVQRVELKKLNSNSPDLDRRGRNT